MKRQMRIEEQYGKTTACKAGLTFAFIFLFCCCRCCFLSAPSRYYVALFRSVTHSLSICIVIMKIYSQFESLCFNLSLEDVQQLKQSLSTSPSSPSPSPSLSHTHTYTYNTSKNKKIKTIENFNLSFESIR